MLETLISSKTRIKILLRFFLNPGVTAYLRGLAEEFDESTNSIRIELNRFEEAGMLISHNMGNKKVYQANSKHPLIKDLNSIILKYIGLDTIIDMVIERLGLLDRIYLTGDYAKGHDSGIIDLVIIGEIDTAYLMNVVSRGEKIISRKLRFITYNPLEWETLKNEVVGSEKYLLIWQK